MKIIALVLIVAVSSVAGRELGNMTYYGPGTVTCPAGYNCQEYDCNDCPGGSGCEVMNTSPNGNVTESLPCKCCKAINCADACTFAPGMVASNDQTQAPVVYSGAAAVAAAAETAAAAILAVAFAAVIW